MLSINPPSGPPAGPATTAGAARRAGDDGSLPEGFEGLLAGLLAPPAPPPATLPAVGLAAAPAAPPPAEVPVAAPVEGEDTVSGDADTASQGRRPGPAPDFGLPATVPEGAPAATPTEGAPDVDVAGPPQGQAAKAPAPGPAQPLPAAVAPRDAPGDPPPMTTAPADRAARAGSAGAVGPPAGRAGAAAVEPPAGRAGAEGAGLWAAVGPAVARPTGRAGSPQPGPVQGAAGLVDDYRIADDSLAWRGLLAVDGPAAFAGAPLDAAGSAEAPLAASAVRQLALAIGRAVTGDVRQLSVQLSPEALGGLEITVDFADERRVAVTILAERPETLDLLRGETRQLERLLGQQGVSLAAGGFELGLMADGRGQRREHAGAGPGQGASIDLADTQDAATATTAAPPLRRGLLNLSV